MEKVTLSANSLFDILVVLSFYRFVPGCRIAFRREGGEYRADISGSDVVKLACEYAQNVSKNIKKSELFGLTWEKTGLYPYNPERFNERESTLPRCYAHPIKINEKKGKGGIVTKQEYRKSPLVVTSRQTVIYKVLKKMADKDYFTPERIRWAIGVADEPVFVKKGRGNKADPKIANISTYSFNLIPKFVPSNVNVVHCDDKTLVVKSIFIPDGMSFFPTYFCNGRVVTNGYYYKSLYIPLPKYGADIHEWQLLAQHPNISNFWKNLRFWSETAGVLVVRQFQTRSLLKGKFFEPVH